MIETMANERQVFIGGQEFEMDDEVARQAIRAGIAIEVKAKADPKAKKQPAAAPAPATATTPATK